MYLILVCEGRRCVPVLDLEGMVMTEAEAVTFLRQLAVRLRGMRVLGRAVLVEGQSARQIASVRVGPAARRAPCRRRGSPVTAMAWRTAVSATLDAPYRQTLRAGKPTEGAALAELLAKVLEREAP